MKTQYIGGLVGIVAGPMGDGEMISRVSGCSNFGNISFDGDGGTVAANLRNTYVGGIVASSGVNSGSETSTSGYTKCYGKILNCSNSGSISVSWNGGTGGYFKVGGIMGYAECVFDGCVNDGDVALTNSTTATNAGPSIGGIAGVLAGLADVNASDCINRGQITLTGMYSNASNTYGAALAGSNNATAGGCFGLVGDNTTKISNCDNFGVVNFDTTMPDGAGSQSCFGGVVGLSMAEMTGCDNLCESPITMSSRSAKANIGGVVGSISNTLSNCKNAAPFTSNRVNVPEVEQISYVGGVVGHHNSASELKNCDNSGSMTVSCGSSSKENYTGGVVGKSDSATKINNCNNSGNMTVSCGSPSAENHIGGVVGKDDSATELDDCDNSGNMIVSFGSSAVKSYIGGVNAYNNASTSIKNCDNTGSIVFDGGGMVKQIYLAGVVAWTNVKATIDKCTNDGDITVGNWKNGSFNYAAGILAQYNKSGNIISNCTNTGDITSTAQSKMRIGGIAASLYGSMSGCVSECTIEMKNALGLSVAGGLIGYTSASADSCSSNCTMKMAGNASTARAGLAFGDINREYPISDVTIGGSITTDANTACGFFAGGYYANTAKYTLGEEGKPVTFDSSASINGAPIVLSNPPVPADVVGDVVTNAPATDGVIFANVVLDPPVYRLYVLDKVAMTSWGTGRIIWYSSEAGNIAPAGSKTFGSSTYYYFDLTSDVVGQTIDIYYKSDIVENHCEVMIPLTVSANVTNYYYRTDGVLVSAVSNPSSPEDLDATPRIYVRSSGTNLHCHMWGGDSSTSWPGNAFTATSSKEYDALWYYVDLIPNTTQFILNFGGDDGKSGDLTLANYTGYNGSYYLYFYGGNNLGEVL